MWKYQNLNWFIPKSFLYCKMYCKSPQPKKTTYSIITSLSITHRVRFLPSLSSLYAFKSLRAKTFSGFVFSGYSEKFLSVVPLPDPLFDLRRPGSCICINSSMRLFSQISEMLQPVPPLGFCSNTTFAMRPSLPASVKKSTSHSLLLFYCPPQHFS